MIGMKLNKKCPNCKGTLYQDTDGQEEYFVCLMCAREFDLDMRPKRMNVSELYTRYRIKNNQ
jgi:DNA-directed RNA polymerase subunit M/transcription elongation factor TFIIS